jgi:hypothetical protein
MDFALIKQKTLLVFYNIPVFLVYVYDYLIDTRFFYPLCDDEDSLKV